MPMITTIRLVQVCPNEKLNSWQLISEPAPLSDLLALLKPQDEPRLDLHVVADSLAGEATLRDERRQLADLERCWQERENRR